VLLGKVSSQERTVNGVPGVSYLNGGVGWSDVSGPVGGRENRKKRATTPMFLCTAQAERLVLGFVGLA
jgi:hypothetical protein